MLDCHAEGTALPGSVLRPALPEVPEPEPSVVESARLRLTGRYAASRGQHYHLRPQAVLADPGLPPAAETEDGLLPADLTDDVRAVTAVINAASGRGTGHADALDVGASLVLLCNLRAGLDRLEADLLDVTEEVGLTWDVIAAIMGIPAVEAQQHHAALRARRHLR